MSIPYNPELQVDLRKLGAGNGEKVCKKIGQKKRQESKDSKKGKKSKKGKDFDRRVYRFVALRTNIAG
jgi:hypothetical protein